jgi:hypothetical protein
MSLWEKWHEYPDEDGEQVDSEGQDALLDEALKSFKQSVDAWSEAAYNRRRTVEVIRRRSWRLAAGWALGCALVAGSVSGVVYERYERREQMRMAAAAQAAESARLVREQQARALEEEEDLLAKVDSDVSRQVPSAMEPLAQLMAEDNAQ